MARTRQGVMLCYPYDVMRLSRWEPPYIVQPKLDGIRCLATFNEDGEFTGLQSSSAAEIVSVPHINEQLTGLAKVMNLRNVVLDGELYIHNLPFQALSSIVKRTQILHEDYKTVQFQVFDLKRYDVTQAQRLEALKVLFQDVFEDPLFIVPSLYCPSETEVYEVLKRCLHNGFEGIIIRNADGIYVPKRSTDIMKWKPTRSDTYKITGYVREYTINDEPKDSLGAVICESKDGETFSVGSGFTRQQRIDYWNDPDKLIGNYILVRYQELTERGVPRFPVVVHIIPSARPEDRC